MDGWMDLCRAGSDWQAGLPTPSRLQSQLVWIGHAQKSIYFLVPLCLQGFILSTRR
jgi:hypothetical protein